MPELWEKFFPFWGAEWNTNFPWTMERDFHLLGKAGSLPLEETAELESSGRFAFGIPIAKYKARDPMLEERPVTEKMVQALQTPAFAERSWHFRAARFWTGSMLIGLLVMAVYFRVLIKLVVDWWQIPDFSHGFLVPAFAAYLLWEKREALRATRLAPDWRGIAVIIAGLLTLLLGVYGAELFLSRISFVILLSGLVLCFGGPELLRETRFALLVLLLAIPIPAIVFNRLTFPLQILASKLASTLLPVFGVPVLRQGNIIQLPAMKLEVAEACSGIRSLMSLFTLTIFYGYFLEKSVWRRTVLVAASIPIAIAANALRIVGTGLGVQYWDPAVALGFFHEFSGWVIFLVSLACTFLAHRVLRLFQHRGKA